MIDSIIFDLDGTLWDSTDTVAKAWNCVIAEETDLPLRLTGDDLKQLFGKLLPDIAAAIFPEESKQQQLELIDLCCQEEHRALLKYPGTLYPKLEGTLRTLSGSYRLFIVSNCEAGYIETFLGATGLSGYFTDHLCPGDTGVPKAGNITAIIKKHNLRSPVYVGDTSGDFQAAKEAGIPFIHAAYGFRDVEAPDAVIKAPADLIPLVQNRF